MKLRRSRAGRSLALPTPAHRRVVARLTVVTLLVTLGVVVVTPRPGAADIAAMNPARVEVDPGGSVSTVVTVRASGLTCVNARPSDAALQPSFSTTCDDAAEWRTTMFVQVPEEPGTYSVRVTDQQSGDPGGRTFTLVVRSPPPPPPPPTEPPPTTTTTARPTTTTTAAAPTTTTTTTPSTSAPETTTTTVADTTTTTTAPLAADPFEPIAELVEAPLPAEGLFLPLLADAYRECLPLTGPCDGGEGSPLGLLPARANELHWQPVEDAALPAPRSDLRGDPPFAAVGVGPPSPRAQNYVVPVLDLAEPGHRLRSLVRSIDDRGDLVFALGDRPLFEPRLQAPSDTTATTTASEPATTDTTDTTVAPTSTTTTVTAVPTPVGQTIFGRPSLQRAARFTEAAPVIPTVEGPEGDQVVYAIRADVAWGLSQELLPLFGESVPYLVRGVDGPPGLFIARPAALRVSGEADGDAAPSATTPEGDGGPPAIVWLGMAVALGAIATAVVGIRRNNRLGGDGDLVG